MVMKAQPQGIRRARRAVEEHGGKVVATEYTIFYREPGTSEPEAEIGYTRRKPHRSVSVWVSHPAAGDLPEEHRDHTAAVQRLIALHHGRQRISDGGQVAEGAVISQGSVVLAGAGEEIPEPYKSYLENAAQTCGDPECRDPEHQPGPAGDSLDSEPEPGEQQSRQYGDSDGDGFTAPRVGEVTRSGNELADPFSRSDNPFAPVFP